MKLVYEPDGAALGEGGFDFCPGCGYGSVVLELTEAVARLELEKPPIFILDIGCVDFMIGHLPGPTMMGPHGRATAIATGLKRVEPDRCIVTLQGEGGFMSVGAGESLHAAMRGENFTSIVLNNGVLADTGGQFSPTSLNGAVTTTTPAGRGRDLGAPLPFLEMLSLLEGVARAERVAINSASTVRRVGRAIERAMRAQLDGSGFSVVEILSPCPTHWRVEPDVAWEYVRDEMTEVFPTSVLKGVELNRS